MADLHIVQPTVNGDFASHAMALFCVVRKTAAMHIRLRQHRERLGLTLEQMEERCRYSLSQLSRWETGESNIPSGNLPELALAYSCSVSEVFSDEPVAPSVTAENRDVERTLVRVSFALSNARKLDMIRIAEGFHQNDKSNIAEG